jgi:hypothetical protein
MDGGHPSEMGGLEHAGMGAAGQWLTPNRLTAGLARHRHSDPACCSAFGVGERAGRGDPEFVFHVKHTLVGRGS